MAKAKTVYESKDGTEHDSERAATKHDAIRVARDHLHAAVAKISKLIGERALTADGQPIDVNSWRQYWLIRQHWGTVPHLVEVDAYPYYIACEQDYNNGHELKIRVRHANPKQEEIVLSIKELYADKRNAEKALVAIAEQRLAEMKADVEKMRTSPGGR